MHVQELQKTLRILTYIAKTNYLLFSLLIVSFSNKYCLLSLVSRSQFFSFHYRCLHFLKSSFLLGSWRKLISTVLNSLRKHFLDSIFLFVYICCQASSPDLLIFSLLVLCDSESLCHRVIYWFTGFTGLLENMTFHVVVNDSSCNKTFITHVFN